MNNEHASPYPLSIVILLVSAVLALAGAAVLVNQAHTIIVRQHEHQAAARAIQVLGDFHQFLVDMETGQRGFLLTGNASYLEPFDTGSVETRRIVPYLYAQIGTQDAKQLEKLAIQKEAELRQTIEYYRAGRIAEALEVVNAGQGKATMDAIRRLVQNHTTALHDKGERLDADNDRLIERAKIGIAVWILAIIGFVLASFSLALRSQRLLQQSAELLKMQAAHDPLTGLANRRYLLDWLEHATARSSRLNEPLGVLYIDLDGFSDINDKLGHQVGDEVLIWVTDRFRENVRKSDFVARLGGDEFVIVTSGQSIGQMKVLAQSLIDTLTTGAPIARLGRGAVGASIGIAMQPIHGSEAAVLLEKADTAMYTAKHGGKRCYRVAQ